MPVVGYEPCWELVHGGRVDLSHDHRHCPAIQNRLGVGITLGMPYTARFFRDGVIEVTHLQGAADERVHRFELLEEESVSVERAVVEGFPTTRLTLPAPEGQPKLRIFLVGDVRTNAWILDGGIRMISPMREGLRYLLTPLPYHCYPPGCSVNQGLTSLELEPPRPVTHLKIPIDLDFGRLPVGQKAVEVPYRTPMVQWLHADIPSVRLIEEGCG